MLMHPSSLPHHQTPTSDTRGTSNAVAVPTVCLAANAPSVPGPGAPLQRLAPGSNEKRPARPPKTKPAKHLSKSLSTPQLRGPIMSDLDDKKRNKLGYQRISIACAHCRRRKIRCLVSDDEREGRCQNCIRLKKECVFYPVDQQAALDASRSESSRGGPSAPSSTVSSSPNQVGTRSFEPQPHQFGGPGFPNLSANNPGPYQSVPLAPSITIPTQDSSYGPQGDTWSPRDYRSPSQALPSAPPGGMNQPSRFGHQSLAADTAPFPAPIHPPQQNFQPMESYNYNTEQMWPQQQQHQQQQQQPMRSMSYPEAYQNQGYSPSFQMNQQPPSSFTRHPPVPSPQPMPPPGPPVQSHAYMLPQNQRPPMGVQHFQQHQQMQPTWYTSAPPYGSVQEGTPRTLPSHDSHGPFPGRPG